jgi:hypothetical protein
MAGKEVAPQLGGHSFSCPHCGALAHQLWFQVYAHSFQQDTQPVVISAAMVKKALVQRARDRDEDGDGDADPDDQDPLTGLYDRMTKNEITFDIEKYGSNSRWCMMNMFLSRCHACEGFAVWIKDKIVWPAHSEAIEPHPDIPANVKDDFIEAASIITASPRGSAALSRMIIQKLMVDLGESGENINGDIASLVKKGLEVEIQQALDVVRVVGNNAVHPGKIDLKDDSGTALALLQLINLVVERRISTRKRISELFANLPPGALEQIAKRDGTDEPDKLG